MALKLLFLNLARDWSWLLRVGWWWGLLLLWGWVLLLLCGWVLLLLGWWILLWGWGGCGSWSTYGVGCVDDHRHSWLGCCGSDNGCVVPIVVIIRCEIKQKSYENLIIRSIIVNQIDITFNVLFFNSKINAINCKQYVNV